MCVIKNEIFTQHDALLKTKEVFAKKHDELQNFFKKNSFQNILFIGCGSSHMVSRSGELFLLTLQDIQTQNLSGGDFLINMDTYKRKLNNTLIIAISRSGETSEILYAIDESKKIGDIKVLSVTMKEKSSLAKISDLCIELPWAFDASVCQTRTVTNLYYALSYLDCVISGQENIIQDLNNAIGNQEAFMARNKSLLEEVAREDFKSVVVLADSVLEGIAREGALAYNEICMLPSVYSHLLDFRHGPIVLVNKETLVIAVINPHEKDFQKQLIHDLKKRGATVLAISLEDENIWGADYHITIDAYNHFVSWGIPFITIPQISAFYKALNMNHNPDEPDGLDPFITI